MIMMDINGHRSQPRRNIDIRKQAKKNNKIV
jgi:hypothetical protein